MLFFSPEMHIRNILRPKFLPFASSRPHFFAQDFTFLRAWRKKIFRPFSSSTVAENILSWPGLVACWLVCSLSRMLICLTLYSTPFFAGTKIRAKNSQLILHKYFWPVSTIIFVYKRFKENPPFDKAQPTICQSTDCCLKTLRPFAFLCKITWSLKKAWLSKYLGKERLCCGAWTGYFRDYQIFSDI